MLLKEFRNLMLMLDSLDEADPGAVPPPAEQAAVELPQSIETLPTAPVARQKSAPAQTPVTYILDSSAEDAARLQSVLWTSEVDTEVFADAPAFVKGLLMRPPSMVFLEVEGQGDAAIDALFAMGARNYSGGVQIMGAELSPVLEVVRRMGERHALQMLPALRKPIPAAAVRHVLARQNLAAPPANEATLSEALENDWIEFWYQPKIDLARRQISGVETFARVAHPVLGTLPPAVFMRGATEDDLLRLTRKALGAALSAASNFAQVGIQLRVAVNVPVRALFELGIPEMVRDLGPRSMRWPGLLLDVTARQLGADLGTLEGVVPALAAANVMLAIDDFGQAELPLAALRVLPLGELKLDRQVVSGVADDATRARLCGHVIQLAHHLGCIAVAVGIERIADMKAISELGCDVGQGFLFGQPMPEEELIAMLIKRAVAPAPANRPRVVPIASARQSAVPKLRRAVWS